MPKSQKTKTFLSKARSWASKRRLFGPQAFLRFVMLTYLESLVKVSSDFVFKGGNLLWVYIETPRATVDLDLATLNLIDHSAVEESLRKACVGSEGISFSILEFEKIEQEGKKGASALICYKTDQGASNLFLIDIVYFLETDTQQIQSPVSENVKILAASLENIVADKLSAAQRFKGGNTRIQAEGDCVPRDLSLHVRPLWLLGRRIIGASGRTLGQPGDGD